MENSLTEMSWLMDASAWVLPVVIAITMHEAAHGWMALRFGDNTAQRMGRVSFNPLKHVDRFGTVMLPAMLLLAQASFLFGYAKPVPVRFSELRPKRMGMIMVALAGPGINILLAIISGVMLHMDQFISPENAPWLYLNLYRSLMINCVLAVFNMIPVLPLDGGRVVDALLTGSVKRLYGKLERVGILIVMACLIIPSMLGYHQVFQVISVPTYWTLDHILWLTGHGQ